VFSTKIQELRQRCAAADRLVDRRAAAHARATARRRAEPGSGAAVAELEAAEELHHLAEYNRRGARRALRRAEVRHSAVSYLLSWLTAGSHTRRSVD
jgi:hypothetical protein